MRGEVACPSCGGGVRIGLPSDAEVVAVSADGGEVPDGARTAHPKCHSCGQFVVVFEVEAVERSSLGNPGNEF